MIVGSVSACSGFCGVAVLTFLRMSRQLPVTTAPHPASDKTPNFCQSPLFFCAQRLDHFNQIKTGIKEYGGTAGMIITTATASEQLENEIQQFNDNNVTPIDLLAADDVAKFVIKHAPDLIFRLDGIA